MYDRRNCHRRMELPLVMYCEFTIQKETGRWLCVRCDRLTKYIHRTPPKRRCHNADFPLHREVSCSFHTLVIRLTPHGVDRLQQCRTSGCNMIRRIEGTSRCVGMRGSKCEWIGNWVACLNGETPFPNGEPNCPFWNEKLD